jgi:hypothetical protein
MFLNHLQKINPNIEMDFRKWFFKKLEINLHNLTRFYLLDFVTLSVINIQTLPPKVLKTLYKHIVHI